MSTSSITLVQLQLQLLEGMSHGRIVPPDHMGVNMKSLCGGASNIPLSLDGNHTLVY